MNPLTQSKNATILPVLIALTLGCFALSPQARAACQEGCDTSNFNTFLGEDALISNADGVENTAIGDGALRDNTTGSYNTAIGPYALILNTAGSSNTATGSRALESATGDSNTATGFQACFFNTTGFNNTVIGVNALSSNTTGHDNTAIGFNTFFYLHGSNNIAVGTGAGSNVANGINNIYIGNVGGKGFLDNESGTIRIGTRESHRNTLIAGISGATVPTGVAVIIDANGHLGTTTSSARYKEKIQPMDKASEAILALKPVTFRYKQELDPDGTSQFGLVAEEVEKINPDLVARDEQSNPYTVRYEAVNAMLLNEFLKEHQTVQEQQKEIDALKAELKEQRSLINNVREELKTGNLLSQTIASNH